VEGFPGVAADSAGFMDGYHTGDDGHQPSDGSEMLGEQPSADGGEDEGLAEHQQYAGGEAQPYIMQVRILGILKPVTTPVSARIVLVNMCCSLSAAKMYGFYFEYN